MSNNSDTNDLHRNLYVDCIQKQLDEFDLLSSIYCSPGEIHIYDPSCISDFHDFIKGTLNALRIQLDFSIFLQYNQSKIEIRIELPHLYPIMENANVKILSTQLPKNNEIHVKNQIENYISLILDKSDGYIYQIITWIQDRFDQFLESTTTNDNENHKKNDNDDGNDKNLKLIDIERVWIYSHHIKSKTKRQEIIRIARELDLTGFSKPGKPGIICIEGLKENTQEFWKRLKSMHWQKITIKKIESKQKRLSDIDNWRKFMQFKEELFTDIGEDEEVKMDMSVFMKFLDCHKCGYMKKELFGFD